MCGSPTAPVARCPSGADVSDQIGESMDPSHDPVAMERRRLQSDAVGGSVWTAVQVVLGLPVAAVANAVVAHRLGARSYGTLAIYTAVYALACTVVNLGISDATVQWIATHNPLGEREAVVETIRRCSGYHILIEAPLIALVTGVLLRHAGAIAIAVGAGSAAAVMVVGTSTVVMSGAGLNALAARISLVATLASQAGLIAVAGVSPHSSSMFAARVALGIVGPLIALCSIPSVWRSAIMRPLLPRAFPHGFLSFALRTSGSGIVSALIFGRSELFVFQAYGRHVQAGLFALAAGVAGLITAPIDSLLGPLLPATAGLLAISPERAGQALLRGLRASALLAGLILATVIPTVAPLLPAIYGHSFAGAIGAFTALAVVSCIQSVNHPVLAFLMAARRSGLLLKTGLISVVIDAAVAFAAIPRFGVAGAVAASGLAQLTTLAIVALSVGRQLHVDAHGVVHACRFMADAAIVMSLALGVEAIVTKQDRVVVALCGAATAAGGLAVIGRIHRSVGLERGDIDSILAGMPRGLQRPFNIVVKVFAIEAHAR